MATLKQIAKKFGVNVATANGLVHILSEKGILTKSPIPHESGPGRPAFSYVLAGNKKDLGKKFSEILNEFSDAENIVVPPEEKRAKPAPVEQPQVIEAKQEADTNVSAEAAPVVESQPEQPADTTPAA